MGGVVTEYFRLHNAEQLYESIGEASPSIYYLFIGKTSAHANDSIGAAPTPLNHVTGTTYDPWPSMIHQLGVPLGLIVDIRCATYYPKEEVQQLVTQAWMVLPKQAWYFGKFWGHGTVREFYGIEPCYYHPYELTHMFRSFHQADLMKITTEVSRRGEIDVEWVVIAQR